MSIFRKRSGSQSSFSVGPDEISVSKIFPEMLTRDCRSRTAQSTRSSCSDVEASDFAVYESCVARNLPKHKSSDLRFLAWVAYTRQFTDERITKIERRTCPLLWCREQFLDQDSMLKHVWNCPHLSKGLYWCFHCQKPERVGKIQCKRCQGVPSRTDRMASVAKKILSKLGSKANSHHHHTPEENRKSWANLQSNDFPKSDQKNPLSYDSMVDIQELPNNEVFAAHELPDTYISEMLGSDLPPTLSMTGDEKQIDIWNDNFYSESLEDWDMPPPPLPKTMTSPKPATLRVDTSFSSLAASMSQGYILERTRSGRWPGITSSPVIVSPLSAGPVFSTPASALEVSPTDSHASGTSFFTDSGYSSATTTMSAWNTPVICEQLPIYGDMRGTKRVREDAPVNYEEWIQFDDQYMMAAPIPARDISTASDMHQDYAVPYTANVHSEVTYSKSTEAPQESIHHSPPDSGIGDNPRQLPAHWCDAPTLVQSFSEALDVHITHTKLALQALPKTSITQELLAMSKTSMVSIGLEVLAGILEGRNPSAMVQVFAFIHIACAFVIAAEQDEDKIVSETWFKDMLVWVEGVGSSKVRGLHEQIIKAIWKPLELDHKSSQLQNSASSSSYKAISITKENALLAGCKNFLDIMSNYGKSNGKQATGYMEDIRLIRELLPEEGYSDDGGDEDEESQRHPLPPGNDLLFDMEFETCDIYDADQESSPSNFNTEAGRASQQSLTRHSSSTSSHISQGQSLMSRSPTNSSSVSYIPCHNFLPSQKGPTIRQPPPLPPFSISNLSMPTLRITQPSPSPPMARSISIQGTQPLLGSKQVDHDWCFQPSNLNISSMTSQHSHSAPPISSPFAPPLLPVTSQPQPSTNSASTPRNTTEDTKLSTSACPLCDYKPSGEERWKASNLRRHKRTQHPELLSGGNGTAKMYPCRFPGCEKTFRRSDNLGHHMRERSHGAVVIGTRADDGRGLKDAENDMCEVGNGGGNSKKVDGGVRNGKKRRIEMDTGGERMAS